MKYEYLNTNRKTMSQEYTEQEKKLAAEIRIDIEDGKTLSDINAKRRKLNLLYSKRRQEAKMWSDVASCNGNSFDV